jgi:nucleotide-binding universal stress UspA family protein
VYSTVLVALDGSREAAAALPHALAIARRVAARIVLLRVIPAGEVEGPPYVSVEQRDRQSRRSQAEGYLEGLRKILVKEGVPTQTIIADGPPAKAILAAAQALEEPIVVLTAIGRSGRRLNSNGGLGETALEVLAAANVPVLLIRGSGEDVAAPLD